MKKYTTLFFLALYAAVAGAQEVPPTPEALFAQAEMAAQTAQSGNIANLDALAEMLKDPHSNTIARTALENLPDGAGLPVLRAALKTVEDEEALAGVAASLGTLRDTESVDALLDFAACDCHVPTLRNTALKSLGKIGTQKCLDVLKGTLNDAAPDVRQASADGFFFAARNLAADGKPAEAAALYRIVRLAQVSGPTTLIATQNELEITEDAELFTSLLLAGDKASLRSAKIVLVRKPSDGLISAALAAMPKLSDENQRSLILALGTAGNQLAVPELMKWCEGGEARQIAIFTALGMLKDPRSCEFLYEKNFTGAHTSPEFSIALNTALLKFDAETLLPLIRRDLASAEVPRCSHALQLTARKPLPELLPETKALMSGAPKSDDPKSMVREIAAAVFAELITPTPDDLRAFLKDFGSGDHSNLGQFEDVRQILCCKMTAKAEAIEVLKEFYADDTAVFAQCLGFVGGPESAELLGKFAFSEDDATADAATRALGEWPTADVAPLLLRAAAAHPVEKYRLRTLRGCIRIIRQLGMSPLEKKQLCHAVNALAVRDEEKELIRPLLEESSRRFREIPLFDGKTLAGWDGRTDVFQVEDGAIVGGSFEHGLDRNEFLTTAQTYGDFYLRMECKVLGDGGNAGVQFHSTRVPNNHEMVGYQADMTADGGYWGCLYDESRRNRMLQTPPSDLRQSVWKPNDWNRYEILCQGNRIQIFLNGVRTVDYVEEDAAIPQTGLIGLQIHAGGPSRSYYRNIFITTQTTDDSR